MNLGQSIGELQLRVWQLEDRLAAAPQRKTRVAPTRDRIVVAIREAGRPLTVREIVVATGADKARVIGALVKARGLNMFERRKSSESGRRSYAYSIAGDTPHVTPQTQEDTRC